MVANIAAMDWLSVVPGVQTNKQDASRLCKGTWGQSHDCCSICAIILMTCFDAKGVCAALSVSVIPLGRLQARWKSYVVAEVRER